MREMSSDCPMNADDISRIAILRSASPIQGFDLFPTIQSHEVHVYTRVPNHIFVCVVISRMRLATVTAYAADAHVQVADVDVLDADAVHRAARAWLASHCDTPAA